MKNIHIIPTPNPSRIIKNHRNELLLTIQTLPLDKEIYCYPQNIHITDGSEIKNGDWCVDIEDNVVFKVKEQGHSGLLRSETDSFVEDSCRKIIFTTDRQIILDGVQAIPEEFLEWFCSKNGKVPFIEVYANYNRGNGKYYSKLIIPKKEVCTCEIGHPYNNACCEIHGSIPKEELQQELPKTEIDWSKFPQSTKDAVGYVEPKQELKLSEGWSTNEQTVDFKQETLEEDNFTLIEKELIKEAKKVWRELHPNPVEMALFGAKWQLENMPIQILNVDNVYARIENGVVIIEENEKRYSEKDLREAFIAGGNSQIEDDDAYGSAYIKYMEKWFKKFKKK